MRWSVHLVDPKGELLNEDSLTTSFSLNESRIAILITPSYLTTAFS